MAATMGTCTSTFSAVQMAGTVTGTCVSASGTGTANGHHGFSFTWLGKTIAFTGAVTGSFVVDEDDFDLGDCADETARNFIVAGTVTM